MRNIFISTTLLFFACCISVSADGLQATKTGTPIDLTAATLGPEVILNSSNSEPTKIQLAGNPEKQNTFHLFDLDRPAIETEGYEIIGEVRYEGVEGEGFLEMWNHLPGEAGDTDIAVSFFSRTLYTSGPMGKLTGSSDWRPFQLPAYVNDGSDRRPLKLTMNVVLPGKGEVEIRNLKLRTLKTPRSFSPWMIRSAVGMSIAAFVLGVVAISFFFVLRKRRAANELRRIQALDS